MTPRPTSDPLDGLALAGDWLDQPASPARRRRASRLLARVRRKGDWHPAVEAMLGLLRIDPGDPHLGRVAGHILGLSNDRALAEAAWRGIAARDPGSAEAAALHLQAILRHRGLDAAVAHVRRRLAATGALDTLDRQVAGLMLERIGERLAAEDAFAASVAVDPGATLAWARLSALLAARGEHEAAAHALARGLAATGDPSLRRKPAAPPPLPRVRATDEWAKPLDRLLRLGLETPPATPRVPGQVGSVVLIGGSLGGGGAERQLVATALALSTAAHGQGKEDIPVRGPVSILCRRLDARKGHAFFRPALAAAEVPVRDYLSLPRFGGDPRRWVLAPVRRDVALLPDRTREGVERLTQRLVELGPDVVHIWQDGMILAAGLAALLAGVPRIILNVRTLPPNLRADRWKPEAVPLLTGLLRSPRVALTANSAIAARAYEDWLGLVAGTVAVVPNGVAVLPAGGDAVEQAAWTAFDSATNGGFTVGGVMRFDGNKRPLEWLEVGEQLLRRCPDARLVLVGDGDLGGVAREFARHRGIADRTLFVGRSPHVGFWLSRFDALLLTSRFEGTPNVLIEAQHAGVPVVTTPAGAAAETIVPQVSGFVLDSSAEVDLAAAAAALAGIARWSAIERARAADVARRHAARAYSMDAMLRRTREVFAG